MREGERERGRACACERKVGWVGGQVGGRKGEIRQGRMEKGVAVPAISPSRLICPCLQPCESVDLGAAVAGLRLHPQQSQFRGLFPWVKNMRERIQCLKP
jgi:hypothetical protein